MIAWKKATFIAAITTLFAASPLLANEAYSCKYGNQERLINLVYANEGSTLPCEVTYDKGDGATTMWQAQNLEGYCESKMAEFIEKQRSWGWTCEKQL
ncbi:MAG: hypothetical protein COS35_00385 [Zetaproteobacteria bacterium CG02_land_8_20_14_3_00_50_9]|nr:MAG: hypothetical protein AUJ56_06055 [Zetaproteobacteria bacterium CG1_02_49_23]PIQ30242.1 MAG: hypothetical protein COW62_13110 [Zetaproteobacteria bacterium CG17_big_fil_post_rev_8_21_14_2_50_50_13]PIV31644.1 MAG: hypothetical protein COS35_00385 [Zetaproteobacteria bacterium CG02_land_8_20_14_3_00_50_9]PIY56802.1 MAG: hypothetical protein COZ00_02265 [Zetaproteobacteria bacterium CG_4_10_14_0_8_um_filter_49_80]